MRLGELDLEEAARQSAGNWRKFDSFCWHRATDLPDADNWCIAYTRHRDSGLLDQSNAAATAKAMEPFIKGRNPDAVVESHSHWACGWIAGYSIRVFRRHHITKAFRKYHEVAHRLNQYPVLDDEDYGRRQYEATIENFTDAAWRLRNEYELSKGWQAATYDWLANNDDSAVEDADDNGGYPSEEQLRAAFHALGYGQAATASVQEL